MADSKSIIHSKYERALVFIRELEDDNKKIKKQLDEMEKNSKQTKRATEELCQTILKKDKGGEGEKIWGSMSTYDLVEYAKTSLERSTKVNSDLMKRMAKLNKERLNDIEKLKKSQTEKEEQNKEAVDATKKQYLESKRMYEAALSQVVNKAKIGRITEKEAEKILKELSNPDMDLSTVLMSNMELEEENEELNEGIKENVKHITENETIRKFKSDTKVKTSQKTKKEVEDIKKNTEKEVLNKLIEAQIENLRDSDKIVIKYLGESGKSTVAEIKEYALPKKEITESKIESSIRSLPGKNPEGQDSTVETERITLPGGGWLSIYRLTTIGKEVYEFLFGEKPVESEWNTLIRNHSTVQHGYGIKFTAKRLMKSDYFKEKEAQFIYATRISDYIVKIQDNVSFIPDIVIRYLKTNKEEEKIYIEYETGECTPKDMKAKMIKMSFITNNIFIIVPDEAAKNLTIEKVNKWKEAVKENSQIIGNDHVYVHIKTYRELGNDIETNKNKNPLRCDGEKETKIQVNRPKK